MQFGKSQYVQFCRKKTAKLVFSFLNKWPTILYHYKISTVDELIDRRKNTKQNFFHGLRSSDGIQNFKNRFSFVSYLLTISSLISLLKLVISSFLLNLKKTVNNINIRYNNATMDNVDKARYLRIVIDNQLTFESHTNNL